MITETDIVLADGRTLHVYDTGPSNDTAQTIYWHAGTPQTGLPPLEAVSRTDIRWIAHDRPGYGGSTVRPGRTVADAATDAAAVLDELGITRCAVLGSSGGGPPALACGALLPERVVGVACLASLAPFGADGLDWFAGFASSGDAELHAATRGADALRAHLAASGDEPPDWLGDKDIAMFSGPLGPWLIRSSTEGMAKGVDGFVDDDVASVSPWGFDPADIDVPVLLLHGDDDHGVPFAHGEWLAGRCPSAQLRRFPGESHISVLANIDQAVDWLADLR